MPSASTFLIRIHTYYSRATSFSITTIHYVSILLQVYNYVCVVRSALAWFPGSPPVFLISILHTRGYVNALCNESSKSETGLVVVGMGSKLWLHKLFIEDFVFVLCMRFPHNSNFPHVFTYLSSVSLSLLPSLSLTPSPSLPPPLSLGTSYMSLMWFSPSSGVDRTRARHSLKRICLTYKISTTSSPLAGYMWALLAKYGTSETKSIRQLSTQSFKAVSHFPWLGFSNPQSPAYYRAGALPTKVAQRCVECWAASEWPCSVHYLSLVTCICTVGDISVYVCMT